MIVDLKLPTGTGKWWPYSLDAKSDAILSLLGVDVAYIQFQLITDDPQASSHWSTFFLSLPISEDPLLRNVS